MFIREVKEASTHQKELHGHVTPRRLNGGASTSAFYGTPPAVHSRTTWLPGEGRIREVYNNLGEELHFRLDEGEFNKKIVSLVAAEFDKDHCPIATVKAGLVTYKRTLKRALTSNDSASRRVKRSRQQRLWEKRCQVLKDDEKQLWGDIKPTMMSEEESDDQNAQTIQRRRPSWRSDRLNDFIDDLDERINGTSNSKLHPKKQRIEGPLLDASTPPTAQPG
eukprot:Em0022g916a